MLIVFIILDCMLLYGMGWDGMGWDGMEWYCIVLCFLFCCILCSILFCSVLPHSTLHYVTKSCIDLSSSICCIVLYCVLLYSIIPFFSIPSWNSIAYVCTQTYIYIYRSTDTLQSLKYAPSSYFQTERFCTLFPSSESSVSLVRGTSSFTEGIKQSMHRTFETARWRFTG